MKLFIQDPGECDTVYMVESLLEACHRARRGGGVFSFASAEGVRLLLEDDSFIAFADKQPFDLVIGIDAVTDRDALAALDEVVSMASRLTVRVFLHHRKGSLFHPKLCWFRYSDGGGRLVVSSGNLTVGGLRGNWEGFAVSTLTSGETDDVESVWNRWTKTHELSLVATTNPEVIARASKNNRLAPLGDRKGASKSGRGHGAIASIEPAGKDNVVLVAEIPRGGNRWNQANFDLDNYENFFGAKRDTQRRMVFQHIDHEGSLGVLESRPSVAVMSHNYRFELEAGAGLPYPGRGRPIGVFVRVGVRTFRYRLLMPPDPDYATVSAFLKRRWAGPSGRMRRIQIAARELQKVWPDSALWRSS